jgi:hypothetical protein
MAAKRDEGSSQSLHCSWPLKLFERRACFDRKAENQPYVEWLRDDFKGAEVGTGVEDEEDDEEDNEGYGEPREDEIESEDQRYLDSLEQVISSYFDKTNNANANGDRPSEEIDHGSQNYDEVEETRDTRGITRAFMLGMVGDEEILPYIDQIDVVAEFVENATYIDCEKPVASLDDRKSGERISISEKYYKPGQLTLNLNELRVRLSKQVTEIHHLVLDIY